MLVESSSAQIGTPTLLSPEVAPVRTVQQIAENAAMEPGGSDARLLAALAIAAVERMHTVVFGEQAQVFPEAMQLAKQWTKPGEESDEEKISASSRLHKYHRRINQEAYIPSTPIGAEEIEIFSGETEKEKTIYGQSEDPRRPDIQDPRLQARYITGCLLLAILYLDPSYTSIYPAKPDWHAHAGANTLASIIASDAAEVMSRKEKTIDHQNDIDTLTEKGLLNW